MADNEEINMQIKLTKLEGRLENLENKFDGFLTEIRGELKDIKANTSILSGIVIDSQYHKDSLARSFSRIEKLEQYKIDTEALLNQVRGARALAYFLWSVMGGTILAIAVKVFS